MSLLKLPEEDVIEKCLLPHLGWNDLLRLRRVCKFTRSVVQNYMQRNPELAPEIEIDGDEEERNLAAFLEMGIPSTKIFLRNQNGEDFYQKQEAELEQFIQDYGLLVKHLRVTNAAVYCSGLERRFLEGLTNLESFEAEWIDVKRARKGDTMLEMFQQLKTLKLNQILGGQSRDKETRKIYSGVATFLVECLRGSSNLEHLRLPKLIGKVIGPDSDFLSTVFYALETTIRRRNRDPQLNNLKSIDLGNIRSVGLSAVEITIALFQLIATCAANNARIHNVRTALIHSRLNEPELEIGTPLVSVIGLPCSEQRWMIDMPNLEKLEIESICERCKNDDAIRSIQPEWPNLQKLEITLDSLTIPQAGALYTFLFQTVRHGGFLSELSLNFGMLREDVATPVAKHLVEKCPRLKKLTLVQWNGTNGALVELWEGLGDLEEISLEACKDLGLEAFVGRDKENPVFLNLTKLKKLSLKCLEWMPKVNDELFEKVICCLPLKQFMLTSLLPVGSITRRGVLSLLMGRFGETIEKFPFQEWSLAHVSSEQFQELGKLFRSSDML